MKADSLSAPSEPKEDHNLALEADAVPHSDTPEMSRTGVILRKYLSLLVLIIQSTTLVLVMRYSRTVTVDGLKYLPTTAVVLTELLKLSVCVAVVLYKADWNMSHGLSILYTEIVEKRTEMLKISVPGVLYTIQNNLLYLALTYLDAATFQVCTLIIIMHIQNLMIEGRKKQARSCTVVNTLWCATTLLNKSVVLLDVILYIVLLLGCTVHVVQGT